MSDIQRGDEREATRDRDPVSQRPRKEPHIGQTMRINVKTGEHTLTPDASEVATPICSAALVWVHSNPPNFSGAEMWTATPRKDTRYFIVNIGKFWQAVLSTGTSHKFVRAITDETDDLAAAKAACGFHWLNSDSANQITLAPKPPPQK